MVTNSTQTNIAMDNIEELKRQLEQANAKIKDMENKSKPKKGFSLTVSQKGCVQINGIRKFPISLYAEELQEIFDKKDEIDNFINVNKSELTFKK